MVVLKKEVIRSGCFEPGEKTREKMSTLCIVLYCIVTSLFSSSFAIYSPNSSSNSYFSVGEVIIKL